MLLGAARPDSCSRETSNWQVYCDPRAIKRFVPDMGSASQPSSLPDTLPDRFTTLTILIIIVQMVEDVVLVGRRRRHHSAGPHIVQSWRPAKPSCRGGGLRPANPCDINIGTGAGLAE